MKRVVFNQKGGVGKSSITTGILGVARDQRELRARRWMEADNR